MSNLNIGFIGVGGVAQPPLFARATHAPRRGHLRSAGHRTRRAVFGKRLMPGVVVRGYGWCLLLGAGFFDRAWSSLKDAGVVRNAPLVIPAKAGIQTFAFRGFRKIMTKHKLDFWIPPARREPFGQGLPARE